MENIRKITRKNIAEVEKLINTYLTVRDNLDPISADELLSKARDEALTIIDVRPVEEYQSGHISGAINVPLKELEKKISHFNKDKEIVAYCRGPYCILSYEAVFQLRKAGIKARRLDNGLPEWSLEGKPVE